MRKHHTTKEYGEVGVLLHAFITSALDGPVNAMDALFQGERDIGTTH
jgi:hypothetical protein